MPYYQVYIHWKDEMGARWGEDIDFSVGQLNELINTIKKGVPILLKGIKINPYGITKLEIWKTDERARGKSKTWEWIPYHGENVTKDFIITLPTKPHLVNKASDRKRIIKITWDSGLQISKGDEVEILRGIIYNESNIRASLMRNITTGREERSSIDDVLSTRSPTDIVPPIKGIVERVEVRPNETKFDLIMGVGIIEVGLGKLLKESSKFLDKDIVANCIYKKDAEDIVTSAFRILEERIRTKIGASPECHGVDLMKEAYHPDTGKLGFGKTKAEREGLFHLFRSSILFLRNPPSHRFIREYAEFEIFEMVCLVNLLLNILEKSQVKQA